MGVQLAIRGGVVLVLATLALRILSRCVAFAPRLAGLLGRIGAVNPESLELNVLVLTAVVLVTLCNYSLLLSRRSMRVG